jgi:hypothetical protein
MRLKTKEKNEFRNAVREIYKIAIRISENMEIKEFERDIIIRKFLNDEMGKRIHKMLSEGTEMLKDERENALSYFNKLIDDTIKDITKKTEWRTKMNEDVLKSEIKSIIRSGKCVGVEKGMEEEINEAWMRDDLKRKVKEKIEELSGMRTEIGGIFDKMIDGIASKTVENLKIFKESGSIVTEISDNEFETLWGKIKARTKIKAFLVKK